jgi:beta-phosphoglucomutase-like phosphatase (HAD superfamily)
MLPHVVFPVLIRCKGILFDMDGIPISSIASVKRSWTKSAELRGVDPALTREANKLSEE